MPGETSRLYFDANVFLAYVSDEEDRAAIVQELLAKGQAGELVVITSAASIVEVAYGAEEKIQGALDPEVEQKIEGLWTPGGPVKLVEASRRVFTEARQLIRQNLAKGHGRLTPIDAVHLATAKIEEVGRFQTYETAHHERWAALIGRPVAEPTLQQLPFDFGSP